jgi:uncharacterized membrane protein
MSAAVVSEASLADIGDALRQQLHELAERPDPDHAADIAANLNGARLAVLRFRERLMMEATSHAGVG